MLEIIVMSLFKLEQDPIPETPAELTEKQSLQYRFGGERYSMRGYSTSPSHIVKQIEGNYAFPRGDQDVSETIQEESIDLKSIDS